MTKTRCPWVPLDDELYVKYHDEEWGRPVHEDQKLFEYLTLEAFQAGLSWRTVLHKRENFRAAFDNFQIDKVAAYDDKKVAELMQNSGIIRYETKIRAAINNAQRFQEIQTEFGSFDKYIWGFVGGEPIDHSLKELKDYPSTTELSDQVAADLKSRGFKFLGSTTVYAHMQATGMVNDHIIDCFCYSHK